MKSKINEINYMLKNGIVPDEFNFTLEPKPIFDYSKVWYNDFYQSPEYIASKFPNGWQSIPFFDKVIEEMANMTLLPIEEIEIKKNIKSNE